MVQLTDKRFADFLHTMPETGMGYTIVTVTLKDGRVFKQAIIGWDNITSVRGYAQIPFTQDDIDHITVTHDKWVD